MTKFALVGNGPLSNHGCEAIVLGTMSILEKEFGPSSFQIASFSNEAESSVPRSSFVALDHERPRWSGAWFNYQCRRALGLREDKSGFLRPLHGRLQGTSMAFSVGGDGYAIDYGHFIIDRLVLMDRYIRSQGIPVVIWGASVGPFDREPAFEAAMARHFGAMDMVVVRDPISHEYLMQLGVKDNVRLFPDPAFAMEPAPWMMPPGLAEIAGEPCVGLNLSPLIGNHLVPGGPGTWHALAVQLLQSIVRETGLRVVLIPHVVSAERDSRMDDAVFLEGVYAGLTAAEKERVVIAPRDLNAPALKWLISKMTVFIGARTHATIAALSSQVPCLSIAYSRKAWGINELVFGHTQYVIPPEESSLRRLGVRVSALLDDQKSVRAHLGKTIPGVIQDAHRAAGELRRFMPT